jgi:hypothetical protein
MVEMVDRRNVLRRMTLVEKRLVIEAGGERFYHLDNIVDMEHINAGEYGRCCYVWGWYGAATRV